MVSQKKTAFMLSEITRIRKDLIKFIPFSFFLVVPGAELLLPPYLYLFPNAFPTTYLFDDQLHKRYITRDRK
jgi:LETM1 and EF-hand domain-containing protein 1